MSGSSANKALPDNHGIAIAAPDGHESHASYLRVNSSMLHRARAASDACPAIRPWIYGEQRQSICVRRH
jgi:hypothetical protein